MKETPPKRAEVQNQGLWEPERGGKGAADQRGKMEGLVLVAYLRRDVTLSWILSGSVGDKCMKEAPESQEAMPRSRSRDPVALPRALHYLPLSLVQPGERNRHGAYRWGCAASCLGLGRGSRCSPHGS